MTTAAYDVRDRRVLVTGATQDAGRATAVALASAGATVVACHGDDDTPDSLGRQLAETGGDHRLVRADVADATSVAVVAEACRTYLGTVDVVVNVATARTRVPVADLTAAELVARATLPLLTEDASIVNVGTVASGELGLAGLTRSLARELGPNGVRVNLVAAAPASRPEDVASVVLFLASTDSGGVDGETVVVDGGE
jgi:NAD(P)-dependent dehydrogenase (short-subunit alcohol dehydrogenase family)